MPTFYVARPLDTVSEIPGDTFRVRILKVCTKAHEYEIDSNRRKALGEQVVVVTDEVIRKEARRPREIIVAKVGPGTPGSYRFLAWS